MRTYFRSPERSMFAFSFADKLLTSVLMASNSPDANVSKAIPATGYAWGERGSLEKFDMQ